METDRFFSTKDYSMIFIGLFLIAKGGPILTKTTKNNSKLISFGQEFSF